MPLDYSLLNAPQIDVIGNYQRGVGMSQQNAQNQMQQMEMINQIQRKNRLSDLLKSSGGDLQSLVPKLAQGGFLPEAASVQALIQAKQPKYEADWQRPGWKEAEQFKAGLKQEKPTEWKEIQTEKGIMQVHPITGELRPLGVMPFKKAVDENQRGQIVFDSKGNAFNVNPYTNEVKPVSFGGGQIQGAQYSPALQGDISSAKATGSETGKTFGEAKSNLQDITSQMPQLDKMVNDLSVLGKKATYTEIGKISDATRRQLGLKTGEGAIARKEYMSKVDNEVLPLLRQTFGAAFTLKEGEALRATLGDPDASPEEKDAVLKSFINTKNEQIKSLQRRTNVPLSVAPKTAGAKFLGFE